MLAELEFCLLLAVTLLSPVPRAQAMEGRSCWGQAGNLEGGRGVAGSSGVSGGFHVEGQKAEGPFGGSWPS